MASKRETEHEQRKEQDQTSDNPEATTEGADQEAGEPRTEASETSAEQSAELEEARARHLRLAADFENYKKRVRQEQLETIQYAAATLAERLLPVLDDAQRALEHAPEEADEGWLRGVRLTFQHLEEALASVGVQVIESVGQPFDPK
ncbi:MAG: nucleotide exchange factor GrpE, partial [Candidatus Dormibacteraeota bacterium]|nr:nucleotide exchange factor GrpE [Candidatus Dormibacteraeota bacterium]